MTQKDVEVLEFLSEYYRVKIEHDPDGDWQVLVWVNQYGGAKRGFGSSLASAGESAMRKWED